MLSHSPGQRPIAFIAFSKFHSELLDRNYTGSPPETALCPARAALYGRREGVASTPYWNPAGTFHSGAFLQ